MINRLARSRRGIWPRRVISPKELSSKIGEILKKYEDNQDLGTPWRLGLAVSGGVDSMALASLCSRIKTLPDLLHVRFQAFVVDHGARPGSRAEALKVHAILTSRGVSTQILTIQWPKGVSPSELPNFESLARMHRYQALGKACLSLNIKYLMLAHHANDQSETLLMRILDGHRGRGIRGMRNDSAIPECYGMYGVYCSGGTDKGSKVEVTEAAKLLHSHSQIQSFARAGSRSPSVSSTIDHQDYKLNTQGPMDSSMKIERGGIRILRPLEKFTKKTLIATCKYAGIPWFEDDTNQNPRLTKRNTIRHVLKKYRLPRVFAQQRLGRLASREQRYSIILDELTLKLAKFSLRRLDPRTGTIIIRFASQMLEPENLRKISMDNPRYPLLTENLELCGKTLFHCTQMLAIHSVRDIADSVSPKSQLPIKMFLGASRIVFPGIYEKEDGNTTNLAAFTVAGVKFQRRPVPCTPNLHVSQSLAYEDYEWVVTREPHFSNVSQQHKIEIPNRATSQHHEPNFELYDGRYWIKAMNLSSATLFIRPFRKEDMKVFVSGLTAELRTKFLKFLRRFAPGDVRYTLPAIVNEAGEVLVLPSLHVQLPGAGDIVRYEIRYKSVPEYILKDYESCGHSDRKLFTRNVIKGNGPDPIREREKEMETIGRM